MKASYRREGSELEGEVRSIDTCGAFVSGPASPGQLVLQLQAGELTLSLPGEVVDVREEGFAFVFSALPVETLARLDLLLRKGPAAVLAQAPPAPAAGLSLAGEDWSPPVTEPTLHQWVPESGPLAPARGAGEPRGWLSLPTLTESPEPAPQAAPPPAAQAAPRPGRRTATVQRPVAGAEDQIPSAPTADAPATRPTIRVAAPRRKAEAPPAPRAEAQGAERRQEERSDQSIPVAFDNLTSLIKEFTHNISFGGMFVYTGKHLEKGATTTVTLIHPVSGERLSLEARVAHCAKAPSSDPVTGTPRFGVGLEFILPPAELKPMLSGFISASQAEAEKTPPNEVLEAARAILARGSTPAALLGVPAEPTPAQVRAAYFALVDRFHPDRHFGKVNAADRQVLEELFRRLTKAYQELNP